MLKLCSSFIKSGSLHHHLPFFETQNSTDQQTKKTANRVLKTPERVELKVIKPLSNLLHRTHSGSKTAAALKKVQALNKWLDQNECKDTYDDLQIMREANRTLSKLEKNIDQTDNQKCVSQVREKINAEMSHLLHSPNVYQTCCLEKAIAFRKGQQERNLNITTNQMFSLLEKHVTFVEKDKLKEICIALCREIHLIMEDKKKYKGKNLQLKASEKSYAFHALDNQTSKIISLNFFCWLEVDDKGRNIELFIQPPDSKKLGQGTNKIVSEALCFHIPLIVNQKPTLIRGKFPNNPNVLVHTRNGSFVPKVLIQPRNDSKSYLKQSHNSIANEILAHAILEKCLLPSTKFISSLKKTKPSVEGTKGSSYLSQKRYHSDLEKAIQSRNIRLDFSKTPKMHALTAMDFLNIIKDVGQTIEDFHRNGFIHHDVKPMNIFIDVNENETLEGILGDLDMITPPKVSFLYPHSETYFYWDTMTNHGFVTPFGDIYGLTTCLAFSIIPGFSENHLTTFLTNEGRDLCYLNLLKKTIPTKSNVSENLTPQQQIEWYEKGINKTLLSISGSRKDKFSKDVITLRAIKGVIYLLAEVLQIDREISSSYPITPKPVMKFISEKVNLNSTEQQDSILILEIEEIDEDIFKTHVRSKIENWDTLNNSNKILKTKYKIHDILADETQDLIVKEKLQEILTFIEAREGALEFMGKLFSLNDMNIDKHPLYGALTLPTILKNDKIIQDYIKSEVDQIPISTELQHLINSNLAYKYHGPDDPTTICEVLKIKLCDIMTNNVDQKIRTEAFKHLNQLWIIVKAMDLAVEMRDYYKNIFREISERGMNIQTFNRKLNEIIESLDR